MTPAEIAGLADEALDTAIKYIQDCLGVKTGDCASHVFSDGAVQRELAVYIAIELGSRLDADGFEDEDADYKAAKDAGW